MRDDEIHYTGFGDHAYFAVGPDRGVIYWSRRGLVKDSTNIRILYELIEALDRRLPQVLHAGEESIARDAAALKARTLERIAELEREQA